MTGETEFVIRLFARSARNRRQASRAPPELPETTQLLIKETVGAAAVPFLRTGVVVRKQMQLGNRQDRGQHGLLSRYSTNVGQFVSRRRSECALRAAALDQATANRAKSEFLANMSHELRTPLNAIIGFSELIGGIDTGGSKAGAAKHIEYAGLISSAGRHLLDIITDILDLSKIESGTFTLDLEREPLLPLIRSCVDLVRPRINQKKQTLAVRLPRGLPAVIADQRRLKQVLINLLSNAHKFTPEGGRIVVTAGAEGPETMIVAVQDNGIGMTKEQLAIALKPFGQVDSSRSRAQEGTGLGLSISKSIVEQHGGRLVISSTPNAGTTVAFTLPAEQPNTQRVSLSKGSVS